MEMNFLFCFLFLPLFFTIYKKFHISWRSPLCKSYYQYYGPSDIFFNFNNSHNAYFDRKNEDTSGGLYNSKVWFGPTPPPSPVLLPLDPRKDTIYRCWTLCEYFTTCNIQVTCDIVTRNKWRFGISMWSHHLLLRNVYCK